MAHEEPGGNGVATIEEPVAAPVAPEAPPQFTAPAEKHILERVWFFQPDDEIKARIPTNGMRAGFRELMTQIASAKGHTPRAE